MRRLLEVLAAAALATAALTSVAWSGSAPASAPGVGPEPEVLCATSDRRLRELSGLSGDGAGRLWAISDGGGRTARVYELAPDCSVKAVLSAPAAPDDVEDLARTPDGTLWLADTGDNDRSRDTIAVIGLTSAGATGSAAAVTTYRMSYPDGAHDAEALVVGPDRVPLIITKELFGAAGVYRPDSALGPGWGPGVRPLRRVAEVDLPVSDTRGGPLAGFGTRTVTGAATNADGTVVALRTYTDGWLFAAPDRDPVAALGRPPLRVRLADEPQGEAIAFDGSGGLLSGSERRGGVPGQLRRVPGATALAGQ